MNLQRALVEAGVATAAEIEAAEAKRALYGGDLLTNLLDQIAIDERAALRALGSAYALPTTPSGELPYASAAAIELFPREHALALGVYPFRLDGDVLTLIAAEPLDEAMAERLARTLGVELQLQLALAARIRQALARDYTSPLEARVRKALLRLEGKVPTPSIPVDAALMRGPGFSNLPLPPSVPPMSLPTPWSQAETPTEALLSAETAPVPRVAPTLVAPWPAGQRSLEPRTSSQLIPETTRSGAQHPPPGSPVPAYPRPAAAPSAAPPPRSARSADGLRAVARRPRRRGPYTTSEAQDDLSNAHDADQLLEITFDYAAQYFDACAVFTLHAGSAQLRDTRGLHGSAVAGDTSFELAQHPSLREASQSGRAVLLTLSVEDPPLAEALGCRGAQQVALLPVKVRGRSALIVFGGFERGDVTLEDVGDLLAFEGLVAQAFERLIVRRKGLERERPARRGSFTKR